MTIKVRPIKYRCDLSSEEGKAEYKRIKARCKELGYEEFEVIPGPDLYRLRDEYEIETNTLFSDQYNTVEGDRIHDWHSDYMSRKDYKIAKGYYLEGDIEKLREAKDNQLCCGYCGARYHKDGAPLFCNKCLGSEYLEEANLPLLVLLPVSTNREDWEAPKDLLVAYEEAQKVAKEGLEGKRIERLARKAEKLEIKLKKEIEQSTEECRIRGILLRSGIDEENLIYHNHTDRWVFGWRNPVTVSEIDKLSASINTIRDQLGAKFCDSIEFKQKS